MVRTGVHQWWDQWCSWYFDPKSMPGSTYFSSQIPAPAMDRHKCPIIDVRSEDICTTASIIHGRGSGSGDGGGIMPSTVVKTILQLGYNDILLALFIFFYNFSLSFSLSRSHSLTSFVYYRGLKILAGLLFEQFGQGIWVTWYLPVYLFKYLLIYIYPYIHICIYTFIYQFIYFHISICINIYVSIS